MSKQKQFLIYIKIFLFLSLTNISNCKFITKLRSTINKKLLIEFMIINKYYYNIILINVCIKSKN